MGSESTEETHDHMGVRQMEKTYLALDLFAETYYPKTKFMWISNWKMRSVTSVMSVQIRKRSLNIFHFAKEGKLTAGYC